MNNLENNMKQTNLKEIDDFKIDDFEELVDTLRHIYLGAERMAKEMEKNIESISTRVNAILDEMESYSSGIAPLFKENFQENIKSLKWFMKTLEYSENSMKYFLDRAEAYVSSYTPRKEEE
jgi:archaellum component FlaC